MREKLTAIGQAGEAIEIGETEICLANRFQLLAGVDCPLEVAKLHRNHQQQSNRDKQQIDCHPPECSNIRQAEIRHKGEIDDNGNDQRRRRQLLQTDDDAHAGNGHEKGNVTLHVGIAILKQRQ